MPCFSIFFLSFWRKKEGEVFKWERYNLWSLYSTASYTLLLLYTLKASFRDQPHRTFILVVGIRMNQFRANSFLCGDFYFWKLCKNRKQDFSILVACVPVPPFLDNLKIFQGNAVAFLTSDIYQVGKAFWCN